MPLPIGRRRTAGVRRGNLHGPGAVADADRAVGRRQPPAFTYQQVQVLTRTPDDEVIDAVEKALTITDNEPVAQCTVTVTAPPDIAQVAGNVMVTVKVGGPGGNVKEEGVFVSVVSRAGGV